VPPGIRGTRPRHAIALRSLFGYLKSRRRIFANPAARLPANIGRHRNPALPVPARTEAHNPAAAPMSPDEWLVNVLIRHHVLPGSTIAGLTLDNIDLDWRTLGLPHPALAAHSQPAPAALAAERAPKRPDALGHPELRAPPLVMMRIRPGGSRTVG